MTSPDVATGFTCWNCGAVTYTSGRGLKGLGWVRVSSPDSGPKHYCPTCCRPDLAMSEHPQPADLCSGCKVYAEIHRDDRCWLCYARGK